MRLHPAVCLLAVACAVEQPVSHETPPDIVLTRATVQQFHGDTPQLLARTPSLVYYRQGPRTGEVEASQVVVDVKSNGLHIEAAQVSGSTVTAILDGKDVSALTQSNARVTSPAAHFDRNQGASGSASTDAGVQVEHPSFFITAESGRVDIDSEHAWLDHVRTETGRRDPPK